MRKITSRSPAVSIIAATFGLAHAPGHTVAAASSSHVCVFLAQQNRIVPFPYRCGPPILPILPSGTYGLSFQ